MSSNHAEETRLNKLLELQIAKDLRRENEEEGRRLGATRVGGWNVGRFQIAKNLEGCRKSRPLNGISY